MPVETRGQKRKWKAETTIEDLPLELLETHGQKRKWKAETTIEDLPLELLEMIACHLPVKGVLKLLRANKRLYSLYAMDQSIAFGKHIAGFSIQLSCNFIKKFHDDDSFELNETLRPFVKGIKSCSSLTFSLRREDYVGRAQRRRDKLPDVIFLDQLESVNQFVFTSKDFVALFAKESQTLSIGISSSLKAIQSQFSKLAENGCQKILLDIEDCLSSGEELFPIFQEILKKIRVKEISIRASYPQFDQIVRCIVNQGIPTKHSEGVIRIFRIYAIRMGFWHFINRRESFFATTPGLERIDEQDSRTRKNHRLLISRANQHLKASSLPKGFLGSDLFSRKSLYVRTQADPKTVCLYQNWINSDEFFAFQTLHS